MNLTRLSIQTQQQAKTTLCFTF